MIFALGVVVHGGFEVFSTTQCETGAAKGSGIFSIRSKKVCARREDFSA